MSQSPNAVNSGEPSGGNPTGASSSPTTGDNNNAPAAAAVQQSDINNYEPPQTYVDWNGRIRYRRSSPSNVMSVVQSSIVMIPYIIEVVLDPFVKHVPKTQSMNTVTTSLSLIKWS